MLAKLMKYEFKATSRTMFPLYGALLAFAIINNLFIKVDFDAKSFNIVRVITILGYVGTVVSIFIGTFFIVIQRFYKNLFKDEGYLMNTIPVRSSQNIASKLIVSIIWVIISYILVMGSVLIMTYYQGIFEGIMTKWKDFIIQVGINADSIIRYIVFSIISLAHLIISFYTAISIGQLFKSKKILGAFIAAILIGFIESAIQWILGSLLFGDGDYFTHYAHHKFWSIIAITLLFFTILFFTTNYILKNKLNLE